MKLSVILCTHNPVINYLNEVIESLKQQSLPQTDWEFIIIDNNSDTPLTTIVDIKWHSTAKIIRETKLGLIHARVAGALAAQHDIIVSVDDDTPLYPDYLYNMQKVYMQNPQLGVAGGKSIPKYETPPPVWLPQFNSLLAIRDLGDKPIINQLKPNENLTHYPEASPLLIAPRKSCMLAFVEHYNQNLASQQLGRKGTDLSSGEDNDINLFIYQSGYALGYFPELKFTHIIPGRRMDKDYLGRLQYSSSKSWIKVLNKYNINPWAAISKNTVTLRKIKAWFFYKAWASPVNYIRWRGACGSYESLAENQ